MKIGCALSFANEILCRDPVQNPEKQNPERTKSQTDKIPNKQNPESDKISNGQNLEWTKSRIGQNPELKKIPNWTKS